MTSQRVERMWIRTGSYRRFRGEWVKFCALSNLLFSYELLIGPQPTFFGSIACNLIGQLFLGGPRYGSGIVSIYCALMLLFFCITGMYRYAGMFSCLIKFDLQLAVSVLLL